MLLDPSSSNLFDTPQAALVNPVNCVGAMGKGLALEFKTRFPQNFKAYRTACLAHQSNPAALLGTLITPTFEKGQWIINLPTKLHFKNPSRLIWIISACKALDQFCQANQISRCAIPALGSGLGGLDWDTQVKPMLTQVLGTSSVEYIVYPPQPLSVAPKATSGRFKAP